MPTIQPSGRALGACVTGIDLAQPISPDAAARLRTALWDHCVLHFPGQKLSERAQVDFTRIFGEPMVHVRPQAGEHEPGIFVISNVTENGEPIGALGSGHIGFHSDLAYLPEPGTISTLYAREVPGSGGQTTWASGYAAYEALDADTKTRLTGLRATHKHTTESLNPAEITDHPLVCRHPESGRQTLFVTPLFTREILGLEAEEGEPLLARLAAHSTDERFTWTHNWQTEDLIVWDNRATQHSRAAFSDTARRIMTRTQIFNDRRPVA
ncbi:MAG: TauD/TfdA family dioxygenase [Pseudomonadota bacterium]